MTVTDTEALLARAEELATAGAALDAIAQLTRANRDNPDPRVERELVRLRNAAWPEVDRSGPDADWDAPVPDRFAGVEGIPEVPATELDAGTIRSAIHHHGGLVVRGLISAERCEQLREGIDRSWEAFEHFRATRQRDPAWFDPLNTDAYGVTMMGRAIIMASGTAYVPDSPRLLFELLEAFGESGVTDVVGDYFGEAPALSLVKLAQRRLPADAVVGGTRTRLSTE